MSLSAWIYARFSSVEQSKGHSLERQLSTGRAYIESHGWLHCHSRELTDEGRSAYSGDNRTDGASLHTFEALAKAGKFRAVPTVLVVENMDRLTRQGYEDALTLCNELLSAGVSIATTMDGGFLEAYQRIELTTVISLILRAELAFQESEKKSKRIRLVWDAKIEAARNGDKTAMTPTVPSWLNVNRTTKVISINTRRAGIVNEIYDLYISGNSVAKIVSMLNRRNEPKWGYHKINAGWHGSYIAKLLSQRAVLGEYHPARGSFNKGKLVISDYFPAIVETDKFNRAQLVRSTRRKLAAGKGGIARKNLFAGIAKCGDCGSTMYYQSGRVGKPDANGFRAPISSYLKCEAARRGYGCTNKVGFRYQRIERMVLKYYLQDAIIDRIFDMDNPSQKHAEAIAEQQRKIEIGQMNLATGTANLMEVHSKTLARSIATLESEIEAMEAHLERLQLELANAESSQPLNIIAKLEAVRGRLTSGDPDERLAARSMAHSGFGSLIELFTFHQSGVIWLATKDAGGKLFSLDKTLDAEQLKTRGAEALMRLRERRLAS